MTEVIPVKMSLGAMIALTENEPEPTTRSQTAADLAQWFVDHEIAVIPTKDKRPIGGVHNKQLSTKGITDQYGVVLGNGLIGIDFDEYHGAEGLGLFGVTRRWRSGSGKGYGILLKVPKELSEIGFELSKGITVRGTNQILVGPGSKHPSGGTYQLIQDIDIADAPDWLIGILEKKLEEVNSNELEIGPQAQPEWIFKDARFQAKFETKDLSDRSGRTWDIVAYSAERGASNEELSWIISNFGPAIDKGHLKEELPRLIKKIRLLHEHPGKPCDSAGCKNPPDWMRKAVEPFDFWNSRKELAYIRQAAQSRQVAPKAVMLAVLCRLATAIPTEITIPPIVGKKASLNFFAVFVGESGGGKGTSTGLAEELFDFTQTGVKFIQSTPGSGEGVVSTYLKLTNKGWEQKYDSALINFDEIDNLKAGSERNGSTLSATLRQGFMGENIGGTYSKTIKELQPHSYRMAFQLSAQPLRSAWLLEDSHGGLPQRFVFVSTSDPECPKPDELPEFPSIVKWSVPEPILELKNKKIEAAKPNPTLGALDVPVTLPKQYLYVEVDPAIVQHIQEARYKALKTGKTGLEGHTDLVRLKVAILMAFLDGRFNVTLDDWKLSYVIMGWSKDAIADIKDALNIEKFKEQMARTTAAGDKQEYLEQRLETSAITKVADRIKALIAKGTTQISGVGNLKQSIRADHRKYFDDAIEQLIKSGKYKLSDDKKHLELNK